MTEPFVTLPGLLERALIKTARRLSLFLVLCLGAGLLMRLAFIPAETVLGPAFKAFIGADVAGGAELENAVRIINEGMLSLMTTQALLAVATAVALIPWTRALDGRQSFWSGYSGMKLRYQMMRGSLHLVVSVALSIVAAALIMMFVRMLAQIVPVPLLFLQALFAGLAVWSACFVITLGHMALIAESRDTNTNLFKSMAVLKAVLSPAVTALVVMVMAGIVLELTLGSLLTVALPEDVQTTGGLIIFFGIMYAVSAVHCAGLLDTAAEP